MSEIKLPNNWKWIKLNEICDKVSLNKIKIKQKQYLPEGKYPVIDQGQDLIGGYYNDEKLIVPNEPPYIIFGDHTKIKKFINFKFIPGADGVKVLKPKEIIEPKFLFYSLFTIKIEDKGYARHFQLLEKELFPLPPLETQQAIVSKIEELFSELDKGIEDLKTSQQQLKTYRQSVLKYAFEGKLTNKKVKNGLLPKGWNKTQIKNIASINPKLPNKELIAKETEVQFLPMKLVEAIINKIHLTEIRKFEEVLKGSYTPFIDGDVVFAKVTPCMENGKIAIVEKLKNGIGFGSSEFHVVRAGEKISNKYLFYFLIQNSFRNEAANEMTGAVGLRRVPKQFIENYYIPVPSMEEQQEIIQEIESRLSVADKMEESIAQSLLQAEALRQSILKKAFSGELV
jgi:type I restriction enzyme S subunit